MTTKNSPCIGHDPPIADGGKLREPKRSCGFLMSASKEGLSQRPAYSYRTDSNVPAFPDDRPILVFDGHCALCSSFVRFVLQRDRTRRFRFLAAQSALGQALYRHYGLDPKVFETNILLEDGRAWLKSEGTLRIFVALGLPWSTAAISRALPRGVRDGLYTYVANRRLRWFGSRDQCFCPAPNLADRFLG